MEEKKGLGNSLKNIIIRPGLAFENLSVKSVIVFTIILMITANIFTGVIQIDAMGDFDLGEMVLTDEVIEQYRDMGFSEEEIKEMQEVFDSDENREVLEMMSSFSGAFQVGAIIIAIIGVIIGWIIKSGIITLVFSFMGLKPKFGITMGVIGLAWIPFFIREILRGVVTLVTGELYVATSSIANNLDLFVLWNVVLLVVGFSVCYKVSKKRTAAVVVGYWAFTMLIYYSLEKISQLIAGSFI